MFVFKLRRLRCKDYVEQLRQLSAPVFWSYLVSSALSLLLFHQIKLLSAKQCRLLASAFATALKWMETFLGIMIN